MPPTEQPPLPLTMPDGSPVPAKPRSVFREHTGEDFEEDYPALATAAVNLFRVFGNFTTVAKMIGPECGRAEEATGADTGLRRILRPIIYRRLGAQEVKAIIVAKSLETVAEGVEKTRELIEKSYDPKQVGNVAIATKSINEILQLHSGGATRITGKAETAVTADDYRRRAAEKLERRKLEEQGNSVEVETAP